MNFPRPRNAKERIKQRRLLYENEKMEIIAALKIYNVPKEEYNRYIVNSLKKYYEDLLKNDGLL